jgi:hypothetical protein
MKTSISKEKNISKYSEDIAVGEQHFFFFKNTDT